MRSLVSISCTVKVSSFIGTPTIVAPSAVTAVTVSYFSVASVAERAVLASGARPARGSTRSM